MLLSLRKHRHDLKHNQSQPLSADGVQHGAVTGGTNSQETKKARENRAVLQPLAAGCETLPSSQVPPRGVEQLGCFPGKARGSGFGFSRKRSRLHFQPTPGPAAAVAHRALADAEQGRPAAEAELCC